MLTGRHALVADFGIARALGGSGAQRLTETGLAIGTPAYMSPEQGTGERELDGRSDIYSLGIVLYEMLAGEPPFGGATAQAMIARGSPRRLGRCAPFGRRCPKRWRRRWPRRWPRRRRTGSPRRVSLGGRWRRARSPAVRPRSPRRHPPRLRRLSRPFPSPLRLDCSLARPSSPHRISPRGRRALRLAAQTQQRWHGRGRRNQASCRAPVREPGPSRGRLLRRRHHR